MGASSETIHGVLVRIFETGVLLTGEAGTGKSDCALGLIDRGHALVADDSVVVSSRGDVAFGQAPPETAGKLYIRGIGAVDVAEIFGEAASVGSIPIDLCIELVVATSHDEVFLSPKFEEFAIAGVVVPALRLHAVPGGREIALLVETAAKIFEKRRP